MIFLSGLSRPQASAAEQEDSLLKVDPEMQKMISQVKDVLPNATVKDIAQDLGMLLYILLSMYLFYCILMGHKYDLCWPYIFNLMSIMMVAVMVQ